MLTTTIEMTITNLNFFLLFLAMIFYWLKSTLFLPQNYFFLPNLTMTISCVFQTFFLCLRWKLSNHFPLSNLYESLLFLSWSLTGLLVLLNQKKLINPSTCNRQGWLVLFPPTPPQDKGQTEMLKQKKQTLTDLQWEIKTNANQNSIQSMFGSILTPLILLLNTFATFSLPPELKTFSPLVPALQSNWLLMHVTVMMLSYASLLCGCLFSIAYLVVSFVFPSTNINKFQGNSIGYVNLTNNPNRLFNKSSTTKLSVSYLNKPSLNLNTKFQKQPNLTSLLNDIQPSPIEFLELKTLDNLSYRILGLGFPLLTIGILSGAVWANQTWGSYWSWDPKETWALITWFIFAIYLHTRLSKGWTGQKSALLASFGFFIIWICYLGVNLMGKGLHSYGFFQ